MNKRIVALALGLMGLMGCGQEDGPLPDDIEAPMEISNGAQVNVPISDELKKYIVTTDERLKEHLIQVAGLKFLHQSNPALSGGELQELTVWMEDSLADAQNQLDHIRVASADRVESMKADLESLMSKMDERYKVAIGLARGAYKSAPDGSESVGENGGGRQPPAPTFDENDFNSESEEFEEFE